MENIELLEWANSPMDVPAGIKLCCDMMMKGPRDITYRRAKNRLEADVVSAVIHAAQEVDDIGGPELSAYDIVATPRALDFMNRQLDGARTVKTTILEDPGVLGPCKDDYLYLVEKDGIRICTPPGQYSPIIQGVDGSCVCRYAVVVSGRALKVRWGIDLKLRM